MNHQVSEPSRESARKESLSLNAANRSGDDRQQLNVAASVYQKVSADLRSTRTQDALWGLLIKIY